MMRRCASVLIGRAESRDTTPEVFNCGVTSWDVGVHVSFRLLFDRCESLGLCFSLFIGGAGSRDVVPQISLDGGK